VIKKTFLIVFAPFYKVLGISGGILTTRSRRVRASELRLKRALELRSITEFDCEVSAQGRRLNRIWRRAKIRVEDHMTWTCEVSDGDEPAFGIHRSEQCKASRLATDRDLNIAAEARRPNGIGRIV
jgi:hypothetical protein